MSKFLDDSGGNDRVRNVGSPRAWLQLCVAKPLNHFVWNLSIAFTQMANTR